jgi:alpha-tubulin suppressor-like RCC1 family protein
MFGMGQYAIVSGEFNGWGKAGTGKYFTVYCNSTHVFIRLHKSQWWRFDTSPHGDGGRGPKLRYLPRFTGGFATRHWSEM